MVVLIGQKSSLEATVKTLKTKTEKLERLCRAMQGERAKLRDEIKTVSQIPLTLRQPLNYTLCTS